MTSAFDPRLVRVGIETADDTIVLDGLDIRAQGQIFFSPTNNVCNLRISNLTKELRNYILSRSTPYKTQNNQAGTPAKVFLDVGRQSYGTFRLFEGLVYTSSVTPPPDIG